MSLLILRKSSWYPVHTFSSAEFLSQIIFAYEEGTISADEIYFLAILDSPVALTWWEAKWRGDIRIRSFQ